MAGVRDPTFWKRFSVAVHLDNEQGDRNLKKSDSWLARQHAKRSRRTYVCCGFWLGAAIVITAVVILILWLFGYISIGGSTGNLNRGRGRNGADGST